jgi:diadenylate cyclase
MFSSLLDTLVIALFAYSILVFLRQTRSYMVFLGLAITLGLYIVARYLNLELTLLALQYFVGAAAIIFAIIFQSEIRKYFELLGLVGSRQLRVRKLTPKSPSLSEIVQSSVKMAQDKTGALIVICGEDNLDLYTEGGTDLDGVISEEVILSIFDHHSEGHDGALVIRNNRISKFGTHLPLSSNFKELGKHGTRHSAALGLTELTDALCIVVSEEKGSISIARDGRLKTLDEYADLEKETDKYAKSKFASSKRNISDYVVRHNFWLKIASILFAVAVRIIRAN